jgi:hypothetical protein
MFIKYLPLSLDAIELGSEEKGFLDLARHLVQAGVLTDLTLSTLEGHLIWVDNHVPKPVQRAEKHDSFTVTWWKTQPELLVRLNEVKKILEENEIWIEMVRTESPGQILYEDDFQIVALPM